MAKASKKAKKKATEKEAPPALNMSFEEAIKLSIQTKIPKKKKGK